MKFIGIAGLLLVSATTNAAGFTPIEVCKATIAVEFGRNVKIMKAKMSGGDPEVSYRRDDGDSFKYQCQVSDSTVVWRTFLNDTKTWGRWRNRYSEGDARVTYQVEGQSLNVTSDQSGTESFTKNSF